MNARIPLGPCMCGAMDCPSCGPAQGYALYDEDATEGSCLEAGTGDDPVGRFYKAVVYLKRNSGSTTVDVQVSYFRNYGS